MNVHHRLPRMPALLFRLTLLSLMVTGNLLIVPTVRAEGRGIPALLQFAEQYHEQKSREESAPAPAVTAPSARVQNTKKPPRSEKKNSAPPLLWRTKEAESQRMRTTITRLEHQVNALQAMLAEKNESSVLSPVPDVKVVGQMVQGLREVLSITPKQQQVLTLLKQEQQAGQALKTSNAQLQTALNTLNGRMNAVSEVNDKLQKDLAQVHEENQTLTTRSETLNKQLIAANELDKQQHQQQEELTQQWLALQSELDGHETTVTALQSELSALQASSPLQVTQKDLENPSYRQDYAAGISLGEDILQVREERKKWGIETDKQIVLAGISDTFAGKRLMSKEQLLKALTASESLVTQARDHMMSEQAKQGEIYQAAFKKNSQVKRTAAGAWYRVDYAGDNPIPAGAAIDVVVKETLSNGTVIQDMEANQSVLSQTLDKFPPLFQEALKTLNNHGSLTLVVPPELAYGEKGYPPDVPPNATMIYTLRIAEVYSQGQKMPSAPASEEKKML